jgi:hypothetical protein
MGTIVGELNVKLECGTPFLTRLDTSRHSGYRPRPFDPFYSDSANDLGCAMSRHVLPLTLLLPLAGCWPDDQPNNLIVQPGPLYPAPNLPQVKNYCKPATQEAATRAAEMSQRILAANPQVGMRPLTLTIGGDQPEIFHRGTGQIIVTEGLVKLCTTDRFLAAVLCLEMGKMVSEREAVASVRSREPELEPPPEIHIGNDTTGTFGPADGSRMYELARYEKGRRRPGSPPPPPDPQALARSFLTKTGFHENDLDAVMPILRKAEANFQLERQMTANPPPVDQLKKQVEEQKKSESQ